MRAILISLIPRLFDSYQSSRWATGRLSVRLQSAVSYLRAILGTQRNEVFCMLALDSQNRLIAVRTGAKGERKPDRRLSQGRSPRPARNIVQPL